VSTHLCLGLPSGLITLLRLINCNALKTEIQRSVGKWLSFGIRLQNFGQDRLAGRQFNVVFPYPYR
jgi:hypothetical protein